jgi:hypothetical protein
MRKGLKLVVKFVPLLPFQLKIKREIRLSPAVMLSLSKHLRFVVLYHQ